MAAVYSLHGEFTKVRYNLSAESIDVVVPCALKDLDTLELCIQGIRENGQNIRRIIVLSNERFTQSAEWVDEACYPFSKRDLMIEIFNGDATEADRFLSDPKNRAGWIFQQFLKLYAPFVIPEISSNVLVLDSDVIFLNPTTFMTDEGNPIFNTGSEYYKPYFNHAQRLLPELHRVHRQHSGICHYMLFQKMILEDLFEQIYQQHEIEPWKALCRCINRQMLYKSPLSEYEIYFNFTLLRTDQAVIRALKWVQQGGWEELESYRNEQFSYMACHQWIRTEDPSHKGVHPREDLEPELDPERELENRLD